MTAAVPLKILLDEPEILFLTIVAYKDIFSQQSQPKARCAQEPSVWNRLLCVFVCSKTLCDHVKSEKQRAN